MGEIVELKQPRETPDSIERARELQAEMEGYYTDFHENPELGGQEVETAAKIKAYLEGLGIEIVGEGIGLNRPDDPKHPVPGTGIVGLLRGEEGGPTIALRADMDALPIQESEKNPVRSKNPGVMHACGHDLHSAGLMGAAKILKEQADRGELEGNVMFLFQPSEEKTSQKESGAVQMIKFLEKSGLREKIDAFFGLHVYRDLERGAFNIKDGVQLASSGEVDIRLESAGGHVIDAYDEPNLNRILSEISVKLHDIFEPLYRGGEGLVASTRTDYPKGGYNVLPSSGEATWVVRIASEELYREMSQEVFEQIREVVREIVERHGKEKVEVSVRKRAGYRPVVHRDPELVELSAETAEEVLPDARRVPGTIMGGEDFAFYLEDLRGRQIHGTFMMVGGANPEKGIPLGKHHAEDFRIDPEILQELAAIHVTSVHRAIEHFQSKK